MERKTPPSSNVSLPPNLQFTNDQLDQMENNTKDEAIINMIQALRNFNKKNKAPPASSSSSPPLFREKANKINLNWNKIANAISHELYDQISSWFMLIIQKHEIKDETIFNKQTIDFILNKLKLDRPHLNEKEIEYIGKIINRGKIYENGESQQATNGMHAFFLFYNCL